MKIISLVENVASNGCKAKHGLSLYIETKNHRLLFDLGPDETLFENAGRLGVDLRAVDTVIISHGHNDHGGALARFLEINNTAAVYVQAQAFKPHYVAALIKIPIGLEKPLAQHPQVRLLHGDHKIDNELFLFTVPSHPLLPSPTNNVLYEENARDAFLHEQNLLIFEDPVTLVMGCGHAGVVNIMEKAKEFAPACCVGGFHLFDPVLRRTAPKELLESIAERLNAYENTRFYTCHCTGEKAFAFLSERVPRLSYLACGQTLSPAAGG